MRYEVCPLHIIKRLCSEKNSALNLVIVSWLRMDISSAVLQNAHLFEVLCEEVWSGCYNVTV